ncbi:MAG: DUF2779 domain-containing protein [Bacteroidetes bacterium]|nr:DUF2779 domain-containing protein [Bacteroidota bacterium]
MAKTMSLSKSTLIRGLQCQKSLYLYKTAYNQRDKIDKVQQQIFNRGHRIGELAQKLFPGGRDVSPPNPYSYDASIAATTALISLNFPVIYEASFKYQGVLVALDMLVLKEGKWYAYEVKSSFKISKTYLLDAAIQYHVITKSGLKLEDFFILHLDSNYIKKGDLDLNKLFKATSVLEEIVEKQPFILETIKQATHTLSQDTVPDISIGKHCFKPYTCDFKGYCWKGIAENQIFDIGGINLDEKIELYLQGKQKISELPELFLEREKVKLQSQALQQEKAIVNTELLKQFYNKIQYPIYFFDLEAFQSAIPLFDGTAPFQNIPFQFSLHFIEKEGDKPIHFEFLANESEDPRKEFLDKFLEFTTITGQILVFNTLMEIGTLNQLGQLFPERMKEIKDRINRMVDFEIPFKDNYYYHPYMKGSYSLKAILPTLVEGENYQNLSVKDGQEAMAIFNELLYEEDKSKIEFWRQHLLEYCKMDTWALLQVFLALKKLI